MVQLGAIGLIDVRPALGTDIVQITYWFFFSNLSVYQLINFEVKPLIGIYNAETCKKKVWEQWW